jgi:hypothetical protein
MKEQRRVNVYLELREKVNEEPTYISRIITGDESLIYVYYPIQKATIVAAEESKIIKSNKGAAGPEFTKEHAHCFFFRHEGDCSPWICSS